MYLETEKIGQILERYELMHHEFWFVEKFQKIKG